MAKRFDIHEWKAKYILAEQFTPDLEDDELKISKVQQMMAKEKPKTPQEVPMGTLNQAVEDLAKMYSYGEILDALKVFYTDNDELPFAEMAKKHAKEFRDFLGPDEELDDANMTGTGASMQAGEGMGHFGKSKKKRKNTRSGYMGYSEPVKEQEESSEEEKSLSLGDAVDTNTELGAQLKSFGSQLKTPEGAKGFDKSEIEMLSQLLIALSDSIQTGNATTILKRMISLI